MAEITNIVCRGVRIHTTVTIPEFRVLHICVCMQGSLWCILAIIVYASSSCYTCRHTCPVQLPNNKMALSLLLNSFVCQTLIRNEKVSSGSNENSIINQDQPKRFICHSDLSKVDLL